ncbi:MAG: HNH endonuclease [Candidatus Electrothrix sp. AR4]|nr:HNH endonuclease [Candidatus Electrothrix sp. AR4]
MTLLSAAANRDFGNAPYLDKKVVYAQSEFAITQGISRRYAEWTAQAVVSLQTWMASQAVSIWIFF